MLTSLAIQNIILIDRLTLEADGGLLALTGETGAGKSILLDALGLALGMRAESGLVRHGEDQAAVAASFAPEAGHPVFALLAEKGLEVKENEELILRRTLGKDGRSKAFINDAPVSVQLLKETGALLVEVHGQFETQGLLDPETHIEVLDGYAGLTQDAAAIRAAWDSWREARARLEQALSDFEAMRLQEEYLKYTVAELEKFDPQPGEEEALAQKRHRLKNREKLDATYEEATRIIEGDEGLQSQLGKLEILFGRLADKGLGGDMAPLLEAVSRAGGEVNELAWQVEKLKTEGEDAGEKLEDVEDRYFGLKELAKKHRTTVDRLPEVYAELSQKLRLITHRDDALQELEKTVAAQKHKFTTLAEKASATRKKAALKLAKAVNAELPDLKLDKANFTVACERGADENSWNPNGFDTVRFLVSTNTGTPAGPIHKIASGGELSRFMLALKVILAETGSIPTLIFDEVDSGIGGATADAVGERLQRLAKKYQVLVVTHSPQVAARARHHWHVAKTGRKAGGKPVTLTHITPLTDLAERQEEIARMLSGAEVTREARAQAARLLENHVAAA
ncbi:MAG: DNA repair protein RecN [Alphaproteobacteria bacterium]|nr:DNA repair protein RecN [Alphaproteobacteria bacterium]